MLKRHQKDTEKTPIVSISQFIQTSDRSFTLIPTKYEATRSGMGILYAMQTLKSYSYTIINQEATDIMERQYELQ